MKTFVQFINEAYTGKINWTAPDASAEHQEVHHQLSSHEENPFLPDWVSKRLAELKDKDEWNKAIDNGKRKVYTRKDVKTTNNTGEEWRNVEPDEKKRRAPTLYGKDKSVERPIILRNPETGERHLVSGHHRATYVTNVMKRPTEVHEIT